MARTSKAGLLLNIGISNNDYPIKKGFHWKDESGKQRYTSTWACPHHQRWTDMIKRCYPKNGWDKKPTYKGCTVSPEFLDFMKFRAWCLERDWEGMFLDKDLLVEGNKVYSPETCVFVDRSTNGFFNDHARKRGQYKIGVILHKASKKFEASCNNPLTKKGEVLGYFHTEDEAHFAWKVRKQEHAELLAGRQKLPEVAKALVTRLKFSEQELLMVADMKRHLRSYEDKRARKLAKRNSK